MKLNSHQKNVARQYKMTTRSILVNASAGTGKSTLLKALSQLLNHPGSHIFLAFTNATKEVMTRKMPYANIRTTYSVGMAALQNAYGTLEVNKYKLEDNYKEAIRDGWDMLYFNHCGQHYPEKDHNLMQDITKIITKSLLSCEVSLEGIQEIAERESYKFLMDSNASMMTWACKLAEKLIKIGFQQLTEDKVIDFNEMVAWAAMLPDATTNVYQEIFVDEAQDLSIAQIYLLEKMLADSGRLVAVGDKNQAIYGFAGAYADSLQTIKEDFDCIEMPLVTNYRCGRKIIEYAQEIDPQIEAYNGAPDGQILTMDDFDATEFAVSNPKETWFLCRTNSHLIKLGLGLMASEVKFRYQRNVLEDRIQGILGQFKFFVKGRDNQNWSQFVPWLTEQIEYAKDKNQITRLDMLESVQVFYNRYQPKSATKFKQAIKRFFKATSANANITLSTIHAAKGFEADTIIYWGTEMVPHQMAVTEADRAQELNLEHIVRTRAINNLILVNLGTNEDES